MVCSITDNCSKITASCVFVFCTAVFITSSLLCTGGCGDSKSSGS